MINMILLNLIFMVLYMEKFNIVLLLGFIFFSCFNLLYLFFIVVVSIIKVIVI